MSLYHIPKNLAAVVEPGGVKNPSSKTPPAETSFWPSARDELARMLSLAEAAREKKKKRKRGANGRMALAAAMAIVTMWRPKAPRTHTAPTKMGEKNFKTAPCFSWNTCAN
ncbi:Os07g0550525 [Oryza sativa Japonica Group]|uniref:Os07g0550525 protein n=1 Tax=Oryza sativa subsp. japonica TaxID=39947 RepID=A0A0P0X831_ORYSJ|nr:Os07g0550525 [Oryza sativa Japonica Group]